MYENSRAFDGRRLRAGGRNRSATSFPYASANDHPSSRISGESNPHPNRQCNAKRDSVANRPSIRYPKSDSHSNSNAI
jgi:hypothetical protein